MSDGTNWTPGDPPEPPRTPETPTSAPGQVDGWQALTPARPPYGTPPAGGASGYFPAAGGAPPASPPPYGPPPPGGPMPPGYAPPQYGPPPGYPYAPYPMRPVKTGTDGFAVAALVFGILGGWLAFVFGGLALSRIKRSGQSGRGLAIAGIVLACVWIVGGIGAAIAIPVFLDQRVEALHDRCASGEMAACDSLFETAPDGSPAQRFGDTCGGRTHGGTVCTSVGDVFTYGDDPQLDTLWDSCKDGDMGACDELYGSSEPGSEYEWFGGTCGNRTDGSTECVTASQDT